MSKIEAMPQLIHLSEDEVKVHRDRIQKLYNQTRLIFIEKYNGGHLYYEGDDKLCSWSLFNKGVCIYFVVAKEIELFTGKAVRQTLVKRIKSDPVSAGIAQFIIFEKLLPKYKTIASDCQQSDQGAGLWSNLVLEALKRKLVVQLLDSNDGAQVVIKSMHQLAEYDVWGTASWYQRMILTITEK